MKRLEPNFNSLFLNHFIGAIKLRQGDLKIMTANIKACEILGEYDIIEKSFDQYLYHNDSIIRFREIIQAESVNDFELQLVQRDGKVRWVSISHSPFPSAGLIEILLYDKTDDKKRIEDLERINHQLDQFIFHVSHDLKSPIASLLGLLNLSKNEIGSIDTLQEYIDLMLQRTKQLDSILLDLMSIAFNEKTSPDLDYINIEEEIKSILNNYYDSGNLVHVKLEVTQHYQFITDVKRLRIILRNLISNSIKYQNPAEEFPSVRIAVTVENDRALIQVEDNGIGIHPHHINQIYDMFFRGTDRSSGSGMGLYIVKSMVDKLKGKITLSSLPEEGSIFKIEVPNKRADLIAKPDEPVRTHTPTGLYPAKDFGLPSRRTTR